MNVSSQENRLLRFVEKKTIASGFAIFFGLLVTGILCKTTVLFFGNVWSNDFECFLQGGSTIVDGGILYRNFGDLKPPLIYFLFAALLKVFGYNAIFVAWKTLTLLMQTLTAWIFFKTGERLKNRSVGLAMSLLFIAAVSVKSELWDYSTLLVVLPVSLSFYFFIKSEKYSVFNQFLSGFFLGAGFSGATNLALLVFLFPTVFFISSKKIQSAVVKSVPAGVGFLVPVCIILCYFYYHNALSDLYWWTIKWAAIYNATSLNPVIAFFARIGRMFQSFVLTWDWLPVFIITGMYLVQKKSSKEKYSFESLSVFVFFVLSLLCRMVFRKPAVRYNGYLLPALILLIPYVKMHKARLFAGLTAVFMTIFVIRTGIINHHPFMEKITPLNEIDKYVITHTSSSDTIWAWMSEGFVYYKSKRRMGTLVFDPHQNIDYGLAWEKSDYRGIDVVWNKFMSDLEVNRPRLIIDSSGEFASVDNYERKGPLREYMQKFLEYMRTNYRVATVIDGTVIWERIN